LVLKNKQHSSNNIDAPESDYLYISISKIPNSGNGLHTAIPIYKDEIIAIYKGEILTDAQAMLRVKNNNNQYFISMLDGRILDSKNAQCFAKYANDAKGLSSHPHLFKNNAKITLDEHQNICLMATRNIKVGEEIFCSYGKRYWEKYR
jgi:hypothetical protein